jgi:K+ transporter
MVMEIGSVAQIIAGFLAVLMLALAMITVRYITKWADKLMDGNMNHQDKPGQVENLLQILDDRAARIEERYRKRAERAFPTQEIQSTPQSTPQEPSDEVLKEFNRLAGR